ncbi:MAG: hypothetical protein GY741_14175, partial [Phycisphaeraceae bacterium]|nr:hypothetical protein [Phycisphaeraceae bacterium]
MSLMPMMLMMLGLALVLMFTGCGESDGPASSDAGVGLPTPSDLDEYDPGVRNEIVAELGRLERATSDPAAWARLGDLYLAHDRPALAIECY